MACHSVASDIKLTVPIAVNASRCPKERQVCSTKDPCPIARDVTVSDDDDNVVLSSDLLRSKVVDDDAFSETHSNVSEGEGFATVSDSDKPFDRTHFSRWELPRRRDILDGPRIEHAGTFAQNVLRHSRKDKPFDFLPSAVSASGDLSAIASVGSAKETTMKRSERCKYPDVFHTLRHPSVETRYELWSDEIGEECMRDCLDQDRKVIFVVTSDDEDNVKGDDDHGTRRSGISPFDRHSLSPVRRRGASTSMEEQYLANTPHVDRHSASIRQPSSSVRMGQCHKQGMNIGNKCPDVSYFLLARQKDPTKDEPMSTKVRFSPYVPSMRKPPTDGQNHKDKWEGKRGASPPVGEYSRDQERRKTCHTASAGQKTSSMRHFRYSSSDSGTEDTDTDTRKKSTPSTDGKTSHRALSRSSDRNLSTTALRTSELTQSSNHKVSRKTPSPRDSRQYTRRSNSRERGSSRKQTLRKSSTSPSTTRSASVKSSSSSSTLSSSFDDKTRRYSSVRSRKHLLKPPKFDGTQSFEAFWARFHNCAEYNRWDRKDRLIFPRDSLEAEAANVLWDYNEEVTNSLSKLTATSKQRFGGRTFVDKRRTELRSQCRGKNETLRSLHVDIRRLAALAFPTVEHMAREAMATDYFLDAIGDSEFALRVRD